MCSGSSGHLSRIIHNPNEVSDFDGNVLAPLLIFIQWLRSILHFKFSGKGLAGSLSDPNPSAELTPTYEFGPEEIQLKFSKQKYQNFFPNSSPRSHGQAGEVCVASGLTDLAIIHTEMWICGDVEEVDSRFVLPGPPDPNHV